jgi:hypothetical protein
VLKELSVRLPSLQYLTIKDCTFIGNGAGLIADINNRIIKVDMVDTNFKYLCIDGGNKVIPYYIKAQTVMNLESKSSNAIKESRNKNYWMRDVSNKEDVRFIRFSWKSISEEDYMDKNERIISKFISVENIHIFRFP